MPLRIVVDVRRVRDFGIGTYIRGLLHALAAIDQSNEYILVALPEDEGSFSGLPPNFNTVTYRKSDSYSLNHVAFPLFLHRLQPSLVHIPLNQVPLFMMEPYVVTTHANTKVRRFSIKKIFFKIFTGVHRNNLSNKISSQIINTFPLGNRFFISIIITPDRQNIFYSQVA